MIPKLLLLAFVLLPAQYAPSGYRYVYVRRCRGGFARIHADRELTISLPNPLSTHGDYQFFTYGCVQVSTVESR